MKRTLLYIFLCFAFVPALYAQEVKKSKVYKPNYISVMPVGFTYIDWGYYAYGFGLERKIIKEFGVSVDYSRSQTNHHHTEWKASNIKLQALYYPINTKRSEFSVGLAVNYVREYQSSRDRVSSKVDDFSTFYVGLPIAYRFTFAKSFFVKAMIQPTYSGLRYMELGHLSVGFRF